MPETRTIRVLCMEDEPGVAELMRKRLARAGYEVELAHDGQEGLAMHAAGFHDVLVVDHEMPGCDGLEVIRTLASRGPLAPPVMVTGTGDEEIAVEAMKQGAGDYVVKDLEARYLDLLPAVIEQVLKQRRLMEEKQQAQLQRDAALEDLQQAHGELTVLYTQLREARDQLSYLLHRFVPEEVAWKLVKTPQPPKPGGERRDASTLFADVRDFSATA